MDNITADVGEGDSDGEPAVRVEAPVILIGRSGQERQTVEDIAHRLGTINHEVLCGISARVPRRYHRDGRPLP